MLVLFIVLLFWLPMFDDEKIVSVFEFVRLFRRCFERCVTGRIPKEEPCAGKSAPLVLLQTKLHKKNTRNGTKHG